MRIGKRSVAFLSLITVLLLTLLAAGCGSGTEETTATTAAPAGTTTTAGTASSDTTAAQPQEKVELNLVCFLGSAEPITTMIPIWVDMVAEKTGGSVAVNYKGGPEVIPATELIEAVRSGVVDVAFTATSWYEALAREMQALSLSELTPWEERENGYFDFFAERHKAIGVEYLGRWMSDYPFYIWTSKEVKSSADLKGMTLRTRAGHLDRFMKSLGINAISVDPGEVYSALEKGIVSGFSYTLVGPRAQGWTDYAKYCIDAPFYGKQNATILANPDSWAKLSAEQQAQVMEATKEFEHVMVDKITAMMAQERKELEGIGVTFIKFSPEDEKAYTAGAYTAGWSFLEEQVPELAPKIKELSTK